MFPKPQVLQRSLCQPYFLARSLAEFMFGEADALIRRSSGCFE